MVISGLVFTVLASGEVVIGTILLIAGLIFLITGVSRHFRDGDRSRI